MNKTFIIIEREFTTRVKKKSFIILTILVPILMVLFYAFLIWMMLKDDTQERVIAVINESTIESPVQDINNTTFISLDTTFTMEEASTYLLRSGNYAVMWIPTDIEQKAELPIYSFQQVPMDLRNAISGQLRAKIEDKKRKEIISMTGIPDLEKRLDATQTPVTVRTLRISETTGVAKESSSEFASIIGLVGGIVIYMFIFMYASQVMKGVIEEKSNRIIEVLVSSVKPFQFLLGKIIGVASVGLVQFMIWVLLAFVGIVVMQNILMPNIDLSALQNAGNLSGMSVEGMSMEQMQMMSKIASYIDLGFIAKFLACFLFYFLGGYLLYASLFAAVGAAVDNETDSQQFMTPLSIILIVGLYIGMAAMKSPESSLVFWSSLFPFTSPIVMLVRIPFGVPAWQILVSMGLLVTFFIFFTWISGRIYRIGILMYGKKVSWKELWKWLKY
ncbi:MAG: ABC transporter permease [Marinifilaceae bacterium]